MHNQSPSRLSRWLSRSVLAAVTAIAVVLAPSVANASTGSTGGTSAIRSATVSHSSDDSKATAKYSDDDIVALVMFGTGRIATAHPDLAKKLMPNTPTGITPEAITAVTKMLYSVDPAFNEKVTLALQSGDPYTAQAGIEQFRADVAVLTKQAGPGAVSPDCVVAGPVFFAVAGAVAVFIVAAAGAVVVTLYAVVNAYVPSDEGTKFDLQGFSAELARTI
ncbi:hypothetical protein [Microbacterium azadirachtae]|uniref:Antimicrobial peptide, SdpC family n=1 Tax=Microbacterium azadirachtae TaxID=582680 RepID=A0A0F0LME1_9MICO|nr:hypothetical protein [Microbacterium azadirachtae]KJL34308.1 hypothetical protein RS86_01095 [Microbacterium azadirachtae]